MQQKRVIYLRKSHQKTTEIFIAFLLDCIGVLLVFVLVSLAQSYTVIKLYVRYLIYLIIESLNNYPIESSHKEWENACITFIHPFFPFHSLTHSVN